jgi:hypothetical protein
LRVRFSEWPSFARTSERVATQRLVLSEAEKRIGLTQFLCDPAKPYWGFASWNDFFTRKFRPSIRPVNEADDDKVIVSACEAAPYHSWPKSNARRSSNFVSFSTLRPMFALRSPAKALYGHLGIRPLAIGEPTPEKLMLGRSPGAKTKLPAKRGIKLLERTSHLLLPQPVQLI